MDPMRRAKGDVRTQETNMSKPGESVYRAKHVVFDIQVIEWDGGLLRSIGRRVSWLLKVLSLTRTCVAGCAASNQAME